MKTRSVLASILILAFVAGTTVARATPAAPGCINGSLDQAITAFHPGAEFDSTSTIAGFTSALVRAPLIYPGVRYRLVQAGTSWCDAQTGFNTAWKLTAKPADAIAMATAYASLAAAPWFDVVTVSAARQLPGGIVTLQTHARTNGVVADWTVAMDARGISVASYVARAFAVKPFEAQWEGLTALPGATRAFTRHGDLLQTPSVLHATPGLEGTTISGVANDGFTIKIRRFSNRTGPALTQDTGVDEVDLMRFVRTVALDNYNEFLTWGLQKGWNDEEGYVYVDDETALECLACVYINVDFQIHVFSHVVEALSALGNSYPDDKVAFRDVLGHEMFHNFQNAYTKPSTGSRFIATSIAEGSARFQETLHSYSEVNFQPWSLVYLSDGVNSCNDYFRDGGVQSGPIGARAYSSCPFWMTYYSTHGIAGIIDFFTAAKDHATEAGWTETKNSIEQATGQPALNDLVAFARNMLTGRGFVWGPAAGNPGPTLNWADYLYNWYPAIIASGEDLSDSISPGGMTGVEITSGGIATLTAPSEVKLYVARDDGAAATITPIADGSTVAAPASGERVWLVAIEPDAAYADVTLGLH